MMTLQEAIDQMTPESLRVWLESLPVKQQLICRDCSHYVIADYLCDHTGRNGVRVTGRSAYRINSAETTALLPVWVTAFIIKHSLTNLAGVETVRGSAA